MSYYFCRSLPTLKPLLATFLTIPLVIFAETYQTPLISDDVIPLQLEDFPERPAPLIEWGGQDFFGTGPIPRGFEIPTGAVWQPLYVVTGSLRSGYNFVNRSDAPSPQSSTISNEWVNSLELVNTLYLTPTERFVISFRPLDHNGKFSGYQHRPKGARQGWNDALDGTPDTLFFEGDFGSIFRNLDPEDNRNIDYHFTVGRQALLIQDGLMANGITDMVGITRSSTNWFGANAARTSLLYAWDSVSRNNNADDARASLAGFSVAADYDKTFVEVDAIYTVSDSAFGDSLHLGVAVTRPINVVNTSTHLLYSEAFEGDSAPASTGWLLFNQLSVLQPYTHNIIYLNSFWGIDQYASALRGTNAGGPLGQTGLLFGAPGLGTYPPALGNGAADSFGAGLGWQIFFDYYKLTQLLIEAGFRESNRDAFATPINSDMKGVTARLQHGFWERYIVSVEGYQSWREDYTDVQGVRMELQVKF